LGFTLMSGLVGRFGIRRVAVASVLIIAASGAALYFVRSPWYFWAVYGILPGLCYAGAGLVPGTEVVARDFPRSQAGLATGLLTAALPGGQIVLVPVAALLLGALGFRWAYVALGVLLAVLALPPLLAVLPRDAPPSRRPGPGGPMAALWDGARDAPFLMLATGYLACGFSDQMMVVHLIPFAVRAGVRAMDASLLLSLLSAFGLAGSVAMGALVTRLPAHLALAGNYLLRAASYTLLLAGAHPLRPALLAAFAALFGVTFIANQSPSVAVALAHFGPARTRQVISNATTVHHLAGAAGIALAGMTVDRAGSYAPAFLAAALLLVLASLVSLGLAGKDGRDPGLPARP
jgi:predicted MFS family arabinose efflux permease